MISHFNIHVYGRVQGVGFRYSARNMANLHNLMGFVRNRADGSVYIEIEGTPEQCREFIGWCNRGPNFGRVDHVDVTESGIVNFREFEIRR